jgi:hypothetical protein
MIRLAPSVHEFAPHLRILSMDDACHILFRYEFAHMQSIFLNLDFAKITKRQPLLRRHPSCGDSRTEVLR